jgi:hypothetical protein
VMYEFCWIEPRKLCEWSLRVCWHRYGCLFFVFSREKTHFECACQSSVCVACQVMKNMFWSTERPFGIDHPVMTKERSQEAVKCFFIGEVSDASREGEFSVTKGALQAGDELAAKHSAQHFHREEKSVPEANPVFAVERETTDWDHAVDMRMMQKVLAPGMQHTQEADLGAEMFYISRDFQQRGRTGAEQQVVDDLLVLES